MNEQKLLETYGALRLQTGLTSAADQSATTYPASHGPPPSQEGNTEYYHSTYQMKPNRLTEDDRYCRDEFDEVAGWRAYREKSEVPDF